jgi:predicted peptidase
VVGLINTTGPKSCANATRVPPADGGSGGAGGGGGGGGQSNPAARTLTAKGPVAVPQMGPYEQYSFYESLPRGYNDSTSETWPLLIFLHGQGEQYPPLSQVLRYGVGKEINNGNQLEYTIAGQTESFVVLMPQSDWQHPYLIDFFIEYAKQNYRIDPTRVYLTGLSAGDAASIYYPTVSSAFAQKIAAIGVSDGVYGGIKTQMTNPDGSTTPMDYCRISQANIAVWMFYATAHAPEWTTGVRDLINGCNPPPSPALKVTYCTTATCITNQRAWDQAFLTNNNYQNPNLYEWLLMQHR